MNLTTKELSFVGYVGVDSGQIMITDPCYIGDYWDNEYHEKKVENGKNDPKNRDMDYSGACAATLSPEGFGFIRDLTFVTSSGYGDGTYPVYVQLNEEQRVVGVFIDFSLSAATDAARTLIDFFNDNFENEEDDFFLEIDEDEKN